MRSIHESDPNHFDKDEAAIDIDGEELCPICGCCSLVKADVVHDIFTEADLWRSGKEREKRLVCAGGCTKDQRHS